jgi:single-strand DNA-binding protein
MLDATISLVGNVIENPNMRVTPSGTYLCSFRLASSARRYDRKEDRWVDGSPLFIEVTCWRRLAENVAASLNKGDRALVIGRLRLHEFENAQGERRRRYGIEADAVGPELTWRPARILRAARGGPAERPAVENDPHPDAVASVGAAGEDGADTLIGDPPISAKSAESATSAEAQLEVPMAWADGVPDDGFYGDPTAPPADDAADEDRPDWPDGVATGLTPSF